MASRARARLVAAAAALVFVAVGGAARAQESEGRQPTDAEKETARTLMERGRDRSDVKDYKGALDLFKAADEIVHVPTTALQVANAQANLGLLVEARSTLMRVINAPQRPHEPDVFKKARKEAASLNDKLEGRIPSLRITVQGARDDVAVSVDADPLSQALLKVPFRLNPGHHVVVAAASGAETRQEVVVREGETKDVLLLLVFPAPVAALPPPVILPAPVPTPPPPPAPRYGSNRSSTPRTLAYAGFGVAGAGLITGTVTGILMFSKRSALNDVCSAAKVCPSTAQGDLDTAYTMASVSTVSFIVAGVGAGVGVVSLFMGRGAGQTRGPTGGLQWEPWLGAGAGGVRGSFQ